jgi:hypothetical protein
MRWDAIIVGARCAGSPLARFLARAGKRVMVIDAASFPSDLGELDYNNPLNQLVFEKLAANEALHSRIIDVLERKRSPYQAFTPGEILRWTFGALLRGRFGVLRPFFRAVKRAAQVQRELDQRLALRVPALPASPIESRDAA